MIIVTRTQKGVAEVLCHRPKTGCWWRTLSTEEALGWPDARRFPSEWAAHLTANMMGGKAVAVPDPAPLPLFIAVQAE